MCHATSAGRKAGSVSTNRSQFVDTLSTNKAYLNKITLRVLLISYLSHIKQVGSERTFQIHWEPCSTGGLYYAVSRVLIMNERHHE